ncbi:conserved hypothetical protein [Tenacibaculum litoreum]|uniref:CCC motif membrane protein n=1 Tax=Tenacibaculum litoreum TaxID=321269 RepID=UPI003893B2CB
MEKQKLPNSTAALVLGICSIVTCCCYGVIGLPLGIIALVLGNKAIKLDNENPDLYEGVNNAKTGKILGIVGIILNVISIAYIIWILSLIGWDALGNPELMMERANELQNR